MRVSTLDGGTGGFFPTRFTNMASSVRRSGAKSLSSADDESESDEDIGCVFDSSSREDSDDVFTNSDSEGEDSRYDTMESSREWYRIDPEEALCVVPCSECYHAGGSLT